MRCQSCQIFARLGRMHVLFLCVNVDFVWHVLIGRNSLALMGSLSKDDGNGNDEARKQWSDWLNMEK